MAEADLLCRKIRCLLHANGLCQVGFPVELLARECLNNAVIHGNRNDADKSIVLRLSLGREWIRLQVQRRRPGICAGERRGKSDWIPRHGVLGRGLQLCALYAERVRFNRSGNQIDALDQQEQRTGKEDGTWLHM